MIECIVFKINKIFNIKLIFSSIFQSPSPEKTESLEPFKPELMKKFPENPSLLRNFPELSRPGIHTESEIFLSIILGNLSCVPKEGEYEGDLRASQL